jgi:hypothetical protein
VWRPAASSRVWSRIDAPETALDALAQPYQGSCPLQSTRENSLLRESYTNPRCYAKDPKTLEWTVSEPTLRLNRRQRSQSVIHKGNRPEIALLLETLAAAGPGQPEQKPESAQKSGRTRHTVGTDRVWWVEKDDLILIYNDSFDTIVGVIDGNQPSAASHPLRAPLTQPKDGFEPAAYSAETFFHQMPFSLSKHSLTSAGTLSELISATRSSTRIFTWYLFCNNSTNPAKILFPE